MVSFLAVGVNFSSPHASVVGVPQEAANRFGRPSVSLADMHMPTTSATLPRDSTSLWHLVPAGVHATPHPRLRQLSIRGGVTRGRQESPMDKLSSALSVAMASGPAYSQSLEVAGTAGYLSEWELTGSRTERTAAGEMIDRPMAVPGAALGGDDHRSRSSLVSGMFRRITILRISTSSTAISAS
jgi:hypothetical protein